jgi:hypothetical protein
MMLNSSLTSLLVEARVESLHRAGRNDHRSRSVAGAATQNDRSPAGAIAGHVARTIARVFDHRSPATSSPRS